MFRFLRFATPSSFALALLVFLLPFLSVSCDAPGGFGRMEPGGTTAYSGLALAAGSSPSVDDDQLRPVDERVDDDLGLQPLVAISAAANAIALGFALARRFGLSAASGTVGWVALVIGVLLARSTLVDMVAEQATEPFADGTTASDYVAVGPGFWLAALLTLIGAGCAFGARRASGGDPPRSDEPSVT